MEKRGFYRGRPRSFPEHLRKADELEAFTDALEDLGAAISDEVSPALNRPVKRTKTAPRGRGRPRKLQHPWYVQSAWLSLGGQGTHPSMAATSEELNVDVRTLKKNLKEWRLDYTDLPWDLETWERKHR
jgi:hypothetical protein